MIRTNLIVLFVIVGLTLVSLHESAFGTSESNKGDIIINAGSSSPECEETQSCYTPRILTVGKGSTVTWYNNDNQPHVIVDGTAQFGPSGKFNSGLIYPHDSFSFKFDDENTIPYFDLIYPWMSGYVTVKRSAPTIDNSQYVLEDTVKDYGGYSSWDEYCMVTYGLEYFYDPTKDICDIASNSIPLKMGDSQISHNTFLTLNIEKATNSDSIQVFPTYIDDSGNNISFTVDNSEDFIEIYINNQHITSVSPNNWSEDIVVGYGNYDVYAKSPEFTDMRNDEPYLSAKSNTENIFLQSPTVPSSNLTSDIDYDLLLKIIIAIIVIIGIIVTLIKKTKKKSTPSVTPSDDTQIWR